MIRVYRLCAEKFQTRPDLAMNGEGGLHGPARWHPKGHRIVYLSSSLALCTLEMKVQDAGMKPRYAGFEVEVPDDVSRRMLDPARLSPNWRTRAGYPACQSLGRQWLTGSGEVAILIVPSAIVPRESNYLLNPLHPDFARLTVIPLGIQDTDPRLL